MQLRAGNFFISYQIVHWNTEYFPSYVSKQCCICQNWWERDISSEQYLLPLAEGLGVYFEKTTWTLKQHDWLERYYYFENILSPSLLSFSILLEIVYLVLYIRFKMLQSVLGKNLIALCFSLLVCDIIGAKLALSDVIKSLSCRIVAAVLDLFSLSICTWTCVVAYDLWSTFQCNTIRIKL